MNFTEGKYFMWEDTGKELVRELINFKFRAHSFLPSSLREKVFKELDTAVDAALTRALNFDLLNDYYQLNDSYSEFSQSTVLTSDNQINKTRNE